MGWFPPTKQEKVSPIQKYRKAVCGLQAIAQGQEQPSEEVWDSIQEGTWIPPAVKNGGSDHLHAVGWSQPPPRLPASEKQR